jgi:hypothetical protein
MGGGGLRITAPPVANQVQSPNEYASGVDNDIYTNCAFASVLGWIGSAARLLGEPDPGRFAALAARVVIPFSAALGRHDAGLVLHRNSLAPCASSVITEAWAMAGGH